MRTSFINKCLTDGKLNQCFSWNLDLQFWQLSANNHLSLYWLDPTINWHLRWFVLISQVKNFVFLYFSSSGNFINFFRTLLQHIQCFLRFQTQIKGQVIGMLFTSGRPCVDYLDIFELFIIFDLVDGQNSVNMWQNCKILDF